MLMVLLSLLFPTVSTWSGHVGGLSHAAHALAFGVPRLAEADMLPCLSQQVLGLACPGCGLQRAVSLLLQGRVWDSFLMYPGLMPMLGLFGFIALDSLVRFRHGTRITTALAVLTVGSILANFVIRLLI